MRKETNIEFIDRRIPIQEIIDKVPKGDYIAVFGTSHSYGKCERGEDAVDGTILDEDDMWAFRLGKKMGLEVFNVSTPGNYNVNLVRQMIDFYELPDDVIARCKLVIAEPRVGDTAGIMCTDLIEEPNVSSGMLNSTMTNSYAFLQLGKQQYNWETTLYAQFINPIQQKRLSTHEYARILIDNVGNYDGPPPPSVLDNVANYIDNHLHASAVSIAPTLRDFDNIRIMKQLAKMAKIPFMWFCFDSHDVLDKSESYFCERIYQETSTIFDARVPKLQLGVVLEYEMKYSFEKLEEEKCDCGHYGETVNNWVAETVYERVIEMGYDV
jgi:hypothetical protein